MAQRANEQVQACYQGALHAKRTAERTDDPTRKAEFLEMEELWLTLARRYQFSERLTNVTAANSEWRRKFDEQARADKRPDDRPRLREIIREGNVDALFERMWLASIVDSTDDAIVSKNLDGIITSWNKSAQRLFGYRPEEVIGKPVTIIIPPERHHEEDMILGHIRRGESVEHYETVRRRKDGSVLDISLTVSPVRGAEHRVVGASKIARDITAQKRAEKLLQHQADLLDLSHDAILSWKIGGGITYWNRAAEELYGYSTEEALGCISHDLLQTRFPMPRHEVEAQVVGEGGWHGELTHTTRDGSVIVVESRIVGVSYDDEKCALETNRDITDRKRVEDALRDSEERLRAIYDGTYQYMGLLSPDGTLLDANRASLEFAGDAFGSKREHVVGRPFWETVWFIHTPGAPEKLREAIARAAAGDFIRYEAPLMRPSGEKVIFDFSLHPIRNTQGDVFLIVPEGRIITDRKRAEEELAKSEERFRTSILHSPLPTVLYDDREQILAVSESWLKAAGGVSADDFRRIEDWTKYFYGGGERSDEVLELIREIIATEPEAQTNEEVVTLGGEKRVWNFVTSSLGSLSNARHLFVTVAQDVTDRRAYEERIELLMREARHRTKNILGLVQAVARQTAAKERREDFVESFIERIQALAANQDPLVKNQWQGPDVEDLVRVQLAHFTDLAGSRVAVRGPKLRLNAAAAQAVGLAVHELATNAGKYGALSMDVGLVDVSWQLDDDVFMMRWIERNGPPVRPPERRGFGSTVIESMVKRTLGGEVQLDYAPSGLEWHLTCRAVDALERGRLIVTSCPCVNWDRQRRHAGLFRISGLRNARWAPRQPIPLDATRRIP